MAVIGVNLLTSNMSKPESHYIATTWAFRSLVESDMQQHDWHLVVVDNGSECERTRYLIQDWQQRYPERVTTIMLPENIGIPLGRNLGYRALKERRDDWEFFVEIHNDMLFPPTWIGPILNVMAERERAGIIGPALATAKGYFRSPRLAINYLTASRGGERGYQTARSRLQMLNKRCARYVRPGLTHPAVKRVAALDEIGLYPEDMPGKTNFEDLEEAYRANKAGWEVLVCFGCMVYHHYHLTRTDPRVADLGADYHANRNWMDITHPDWIDWHAEFSAHQEKLYTGLPMRWPH